MAYSNNCGHSEFTAPYIKYSIDITGDGNGKFNLVFKYCKLDGYGADNWLHFSFWMNAYASSDPVTPFDSYSGEDYGIYTWYSDIGEWVTALDLNIDVNKGIGRFHYTPTEFKISVNSDTPSKGVLPVSNCSFRSDWKGPGLISAYIYHMMYDSNTEISEHTTYTGYGDEPPAVSKLANNYPAFYLDHAEVAGITITSLETGMSEITLFYKPVGNYWYTENQIIDISTNMCKVYYAEKNVRLQYPNKDVDGQDPIAKGSMKIYKFNRNNASWRDTIDLYYSAFMYSNLDNYQVLPKIYLSRSLDNFNFMTGTPYYISAQGEGFIEDSIDFNTYTYYLIIVPPYEDKITYMEYTLEQQPHGSWNTPSQYFKVEMTANPDLDYRDYSLVLSKSYDQWNLQRLYNGEVLQLKFTLPWDCRQLLVWYPEPIYSERLTMYLSDNFYDISRQGVPTSYFAVYTATYGRNYSFDLPENYGKQGHTIVISFRYTRGNSSYDRLYLNLATDSWIVPTLNSTHSVRLEVADVYRNGSSYTLLDQSRAYSRCNNASTYRDSDTYETFYENFCTATPNEPAILYARGINDNTIDIYHMRFLGWATSPTGNVVANSNVPLFTIYPTTEATQKWYAIYERVTTPFNWTTNVSQNAPFNLKASDWNELTNRIIFSTGLLGTTYLANRYSEVREYAQDNYYYVNAGDPVSANAYNHVVKTLNMLIGSNIATVLPNSLITASCLNIIKDTLNNYIASK